MKTRFRLFGRSIPLNVTVGASGSCLVSLILCIASVLCGLPTSALKSLFGAGVHLNITIATAPATDPVVIGTPIGTATLLPTLTATSQSNPVTLSRPASQRTPTPFRP